MTLFIVLAILAALGGLIVGAFAGLIFVGLVAGLIGAGILVLIGWGAGKATRHKITDQSEAPTS